MAWLQDYGLVVDIVICLLLVTTIGYAVALNRKLAVLRSARGEMEKLFADFAAATGQAEGGLQALKQSSSEAGETLAQNVSDACRLADEMAFLVKKGNEIADRLEVAIAASRKAAQSAQSVQSVQSAQSAQSAQAPRRPAAPQAGPQVSPLSGVAPQPVAAAPAPQAGGGDETAARGIAKLAKRKLSNADTELMRALQAIR